MADNIIFKSTKPGYHWKVYTHKPEGRPGYAMAQEGKLEMGDDGRVRGFVVELFTDRNVRQNIDGRFTAKNRDAAVTALVKILTDNQFIEPENNA